MSEEFSLPLRVYIEDTDAGGIVFYVNYLKYMERARTEFMRQFDMPRNAIFNTEHMFVVRRAEIDYRLPARLDDELRVTAVLKDLRGASMNMEQAVYRESELLVQAEVSLACVSPDSLAPRRIPKELLATLRAALNPAETD